MPGVAYARLSGFFFAISANSPIGRGLIGKEVGDTVKIQIPGGLRELEILKLTTIHEMVE